MFVSDFDNSRIRHLFGRMAELSDFEELYDEDDVVMTKLIFEMDGSSDAVLIWVVGESDILISKYDLFYLIKAYDKGYRRILSQGMTHTTC